MFGWGTWIRTKIDGVRVRCSTIELFPSRQTGGRFGWCAALINKSPKIANTCFEKNPVLCGPRSTIRKSLVQKRIWRFRRALISLRQRKNRMSACCIPLGLARRDGKRTWKTPKAAPSRNLTGRRRQGAGTARSPGAARASVAGNPAARLIPLRMSFPAMPDSLRAR